MWNRNCSSLGTVHPNPPSRSERKQSPRRASRDQHGFKLITPQRRTMIAMKFTMAVQAIVRRLPAAHGDPGGGTSPTLRFSVTAPSPGYAGRRSPKGGEVSERSPPPCGTNRGGGSASAAQSLGGCCARRRAAREGMSWRPTRRRRRGMRDVTGHTRSKRGTHRAEREHGPAAVDQREGQRAAERDDRAREVRPARDGRSDVRQEADLIQEAAGRDRSARCSISLGSTTSTTSRPPRLELTAAHPALFGLDVIHGDRTMFPVPLGRGRDLGSDPGGEGRVACPPTRSGPDGIKWTF